MDHVYLIPHGDGTYEARILPAAPCASAVLLTAEREYPVECIYRRLDLNGSAVYERYTCASREELLHGLNCGAEALHTVWKLWDFHAAHAEPHDAWIIFNAALDRFLELLREVDL